MVIVADESATQEPLPVRISAAVTPRLATTWHVPPGWWNPSSAGARTGQCDGKSDAFPRYPGSKPTNVVPLNESFHR